MEMDMENPEEIMGSTDHTQIAKGKRTKRPRPSSPSSPVVTTSTSSSGGMASSADDHNYESTTDEEEDMANCLILLAQGGGIGANRKNSIKVEKEKIINVQKFSEMVSYECKTCNKSFQSFQALGGHRASHKKPKSSNNDVEELQFNKNNIFNPTSTTVSLHVSPFNKSSLPSSSTSKVHECSICGSEFSSGQALGGHMRRHRAVPTGTQVGMASIDTTEEVIGQKSRSILSLDLNLPAPEDDDFHYRDSKFHQFTNQKRPFVFSAPALVDCHY